MNVNLSIDYYTRWGENLVLVANGEKYPMKWSGHREGLGDNIWSVTIENCETRLLNHYHYCVEKEGRTIRSEWSHHSSEMIGEIHDKWINPPFRAAGTAVPVFALRSKEDFGIGEFRDLHLIVDWAVETGQKVIQLLPINDTTQNYGWGDAFPYSPISAFALNPMYVRLQDLGIEEDEPFRRKRDELNSTEEIDYPKVCKAKMAYMRKAYEKRGAKELSSAEFRKFKESNYIWLDEYCTFCAERDKIEKEFYAWVQFHLDRQLARAVAYARGKGVALKGDLPIGVSRESVECHCHPELFNMDSNAGAPPDQFSKTGQNWGFPTYDWEEMAKDNYAWWQARLRKMAEYFDAFRIDHILGFFRIWEIPSQCKGGLEGHFNPALPLTRKEIKAAGLPIEGLFHKDPRNPGMFQPLIRPAAGKLTAKQKDAFAKIHDDFFYRRNESFWKENALRRLRPLLGVTKMLPCGEDLGMVPDCVPEVMDELDILSLRMRSMEGPGAWVEKSVCSTSSHDMETLRMQCENDPSGALCEDMLMEFLQSPSVLAIFPLQDWLSVDEGLRRAERNDERVNNPAKSKGNWRYRVHFPLEELTGPGCDNLNRIVTTMLNDSGRRKV